MSYKEVIYINCRLKALRKELGLSQKDFGAKIFLSQDHISSLEKGRRTLTDRSIHDICSQFGVNEDWIRNGEGDMYVDLTADMDLPDNIKEMIRKISKLSPESQEKMNQILDVFISESQDNK